jgi:hypothetical protein
MLACQSRAGNGFLMSWRFVLLAGAFHCGCAAGAAPAEPAENVPEVAVLKKARVQTSGPGLLEFFRARSPNRTNQARIQVLIERLGSDSFRIRQRAAAELISLGPVASPLVRGAVSSTDPEVHRLAQLVLDRIAGAYDPMVAAAAGRLLARRRPAGTVGVLLAFVPVAEDYGIAGEIQSVLTTLALEHGKPDPVLVAALQDAEPLRRMAAAEALCQAGAPVAALRSLLRDSDARVRLCMARGLARRREKTAIPVLIDLLADLPLEQAWQVEDLLRRAAGPQAPDAVPAEDSTGRRRWRQAWRDWWRAHHGQVDLARLAGGRDLLGYTLVAQWDYQGRVNELIELGPNRTVRWKIDNLGYSFDFDVLPGQRLLVVEHLANRVTERDFKGRVRWEYQVNGPVNCQRLANGNTFIAATNQVLEVTPRGKEVFKIDVPGLMAGAKLANGQVAAVTAIGQCFRMDASGQKLKTFSIGGMMNNSGGIEPLAGGRILIASYVMGKVMEFDADGKLVWQHAINTPGFATRLANGNTLITSQADKYAVEVTRAGKEVWAYRPGQAIWRARRR